MQEINYVFELPSPEAASLKSMIQDKDSNWLQNELATEKLQIGSAYNNGKTEDSMISRYASETIVDLNAKLEILKYNHRKKQFSIDRTSEKRIFTIDVGKTSKKIRLKVLDCLQDSIFETQVMSLIKKEQKEIEKDPEYDSFWFYCPILDDQKQNPRTNHFIVYLFHLQVSQEKEFILRRCSLDSINEGRISHGMAKLETSFQTQIGYKNSIQPIEQLIFGPNTKQQNSFDCSHYVISNLEYLLTAGERLWEELDSNSVIHWDGIAVPGGYYASKLLRLKALSNRGNQNFKKIISAFNPDCSHQEEREINEGPLIHKKLKKY